MILSFKKYQGTGNDFIIIDNRENSYRDLDVAKLCHPKFGIGGDGLMLLQNADDCDFEMVYYNSDGQISSMCGNGGRCIVDFAKKLSVFKGSETLFKAIDGPHHASWTEQLVELQMKDVEQIKMDGAAYVLNTGSPHYVEFRENIHLIDMVNEARSIRYNDTYKTEGINVNFVELVSPNHIKVRTYERGVENETLSCGTGVTASAIALSSKLGLQKGLHEIKIETPGGILNVKYRLNDRVEDVWLCGPATEVYEGRMLMS